MKTLSAGLLIALLSTGAALAQDDALDGAHGAHFIENWDQDDDNAVTLDEARTKRGDVFIAFDADEDGSLSAEEYAMFDEMRAIDRASIQEDANGRGEGKGNGVGHGKGNAKGHGMGLGKGMMGGGEEGGMTRAFNDTNGDGLVSREEFMAQTESWIAMMDRNGDGRVTVDDFGK